MWLRFDEADYNLDNFGTITDSQSQDKWILRLFDATNEEVVKEIGPFDVSVDRMCLILHVIEYNRYTNKCFDLSAYLRYLSKFELTENVSEVDYCFFKDNQLEYE